MLDEVKQAEHKERGSAQNPARDAPLRGVNSELSAQARSLADHRCSLIKNLGKIAARLLLQKNCGGEKPHVIHRRPIDQIRHCVPKGKTQGLLLVQSTEFYSDWIGNLIADYLQHGLD